MTKLVALPADASPTGDDLFYMIGAPGTVPVDRKVEADDVATSAPFTSRYAPAVQAADPAFTGTYLQFVSGAALNAYLAALPAWSPGDPVRKVLVQGGNFSRTGILTVPGGVVLDLTGVTLTLANATNTDMVNVTGDDVTIINGTLDGNRANQTSNGIGITGTGLASLTLDGTRLVDTREEAVLLSDLTDLSITRSRIANCGVAGNRKAIYIDGTCTGINLDDIFIDGTGSQNGGIQIAAIVAADVISGITINQVNVRLGSNAAARLGIELYSNNGGLITGGTIDGCDITCPGSGTLAFGISLGGVATGAAFGNKNIAITGGSISGCDGPAIEIIGSGITATGVTLIDSGPISVISTDVAGGIRGVSITACPSIGCTQANYAIQLKGDTTNPIYGLVCDANPIDDCAGIGIAIDGRVLGCIISRNPITRPGASAIAIGAAAIVTGTQISGNYIDGTGAAANSDGILINSTTADDLTIDNNVIDDCVRYGINFNAAADRCTLRNNTVTGCVYGITTGAGGDRYVFIGNYCHDNTTRGISFSGSPTNVYMRGNIANNTAGSDIVLGSATLINSGTVTLIGGTATVSNTSVTAASRILTDIQSLGTVTVPKAIGVTARTAGTSFVITSADATDTSVIAWEIFAA